MPEKKPELPKLTLPPQVSSFQNDPFVPNTSKYIKTEKYFEQKKKDEVRAKKIEEQEKNKPKPTLEDMRPPGSQFGPPKNQYSKNPMPTVNVQVVAPPQQQQPQNDKRKNDPLDILYDTLPFYAKNPTVPYNLIDVPRYSVINKNYYNLDGGPNADHKKLSNVYENIFPKKVINRSFLSLKKRERMTKFIRSVLIDEGDGGTVLLDAYAGNTLISHLKLLHLNPFSTNDFSNNPYHGLSKGALVYSSCFPINYDSENNNTTCAYNSAGMMVKIYQQHHTQATFVAGVAPHIHLSGYESLQNFYNFVKLITSQRICPHFVRMHAYYQMPVDNVVFDDISAKRRSAVTVVGGGMNIGDFVSKSSGPTPNNAVSNLGPLKIRDKKEIEKLGGIRVTGNVTGNSGLSPIHDKCHIFLTEAPTFTYAQWKKNKYESNGKKNIQIYSNVHKTGTDLNIKFQLYYTLRVLYRKQKIFNDLEKNIYIKDIDKKITGKYWIYNLFGIKYYIKNLNYILLLDCEFKLNTVTFGTPTPYPLLFNIVDRNIDNTTFATVKNTAFNIFSKFLHNRIGTDVRQSEIEYVDKTSGSNHKFDIGELAVMKESNKYKYVLILDKIDKNVNSATYNKIKCLVNRLGTTKNIDIGDLYKLYTQDIVQDQDEEGFVFDKNELIETYALS